MKLKIVIVGCGQIGSRHLQGLSRLNERAVIYLVDNVAKSIEIAKERFYEVVSKDKIDQIELKVRNITEIEDDIDVAIIATSSSNRAQLTKEFVLHNKVKYIVFEKFLFQKKSDYSEIQSLLKENNINAWVNQWMSSSRPFQDMLHWFDGNLEKVVVDGNNWGMACNSVHFVDFFDFSTNRKGVHVVDCSIDDKVVKSKRPGYYELTGKMDFVSDNIKLNISCKKISDEVYINILIKGGTKKIEAKLSLGVLKVSYYSESDKAASKNYKLPMQSELTGGLVKQIITHSSCGLPTYQQSMAHHLLLFKCFEKTFKAMPEDVAGCPIT